MNAGPETGRLTLGRVIGVDYRLATVIPAAFVAIWVAAIPASGWAGHLSVTAAATAVIGIGVITVNGFTVPQWCRKRAAVALARPRHRATREEPGAAATAVVAGQEVGVIWDGGQLICALNLHGHPHVPHWLIQRRVETTATVPLDALDAALDQLGPGRPCSVDLVLDGNGLTRTGYAGIYDTQLSGRPVTGDRTTVLIARFFPRHAVTYYAARTSLSAAAATSLSRIAATLAAAGCPCTPLTAPELEELAARSRTRGPQHWNYLTGAGDTGAQTDTIYSIDPAALRDHRFRELWAIRTDSVMATLRRDAGGWSGFARVRGPRPPASPPLPFLKGLPGQQAVAARIGRPVADTAPVTTIYQPVARPADLHPPAGPDGQVLGMTDVGELLLVPLVPGQERVIAARLDAIYAEQLIRRAEATGALVTIITTREHRWTPLTGPRIRTAVPGAELATGPAHLHIYDGLPAPSVPETATLELIALDGPAPEGDMTFDQRGDIITISSGPTTITVRAVITPAERPHLPSSTQQRRRGDRELVGVR
ncbi:ESX-2 secretion system protein EccE2 [Mycobacterium talmoniae]|uniref:ESX-2 secretion system protein EccE2 n=1 Tax=Mycobacterium talmoniae TaxID=1858794 RepID=A0A2S8BFA4_9MYCO|nr:ESX-2 secretion system protein EccE2 [Mycobacterium talmoniae]